MPSIAFRIAGQYKPTNDAAVRASLRDAFSHGKVDDDVTCPETHRIVAIRGTLDDTHALVGGGAFTVRGRFSTRGDVGGCETNKALRMYLTQTAEESIGGRRAMVGRPSVALAAMPSSVRNPARKRKAAKRRNPSPKSSRVNIAAHLPGVPPLWGTMKTVGGLLVVEVSPTLYLTPDLEVETSKFSRAQGDEFTGWVVRCDRHSENSDPIPTKAEALRAMVNWPRGRR